MNGSVAADSEAIRSARSRIRTAWITSWVHALGSALILLATGVNLVLAAHYPLASAAAVLLLGEGVRRRSRLAAFLLFAAALAPALIKVILGALHPTDLPAFPLAFLYGRGFLGTLRYHRAAVPPRVTARR
jgi:hypothetical protein